MYNSLSTTMQFLQTRVPRVRAVISEKRQSHVRGEHLPRPIKSHQSLFVARVAVPCPIHNPPCARGQRRRTQLKGVSLVQKSGLRERYSPFKWAGGELGNCNLPGLKWRRWEIYVVCHCVHDFIHQMNLLDGSICVCMEFRRNSRVVLWISLNEQNWYPVAIRNDHSMNQTLKQLKNALKWRHHALK